MLMAYNHVFLTQEQSKQKKPLFYYKKSQEMDCVILLKTNGEGRVKKLHKICTGIFFHLYYRTGIKQNIFLILMPRNPRTGMKRWMGSGNHQ